MKPVGKKNLRNAIQPRWLGVFIRQFSHSVEERFKHTVDRIPLEDLCNGWNGQLPQARLRLLSPFEIG